MAPNTYPNGKDKAVASTSNDAKTQFEQIEQQKSRLPYSIYMHRQQLRKRKLTFIDIATSKFHLTYELIKKTIQTGPECSREDLAIASRETIFQTSLLREMDKYKASQAKQMKKSYNRYYKKFQKQVQQKQQEQIVESLKTQRPKPNFTTFKQKSKPQATCDDNDNSVLEDNGTTV